MPDREIIGAIAGGEELLAWFGWMPSFHDAHLLELTLTSEGPGRLCLYTWNLTGEVDEAGYFVGDRHAVVEFTLGGVTEFGVVDFVRIPAIVRDLAISRSEGALRIDWRSSYGAEGFVEATSLEVAVKPGRVVTA